MYILIVEKKVNQIGTSTAKVLLRLRLENMELLKLHARSWNCMQANGTLETYGNFGNPGKVEYQFGLKAVVEETILG